MDAPYPIRYEFRFADGSTAELTARLHPATLELMDRPQEPLPAWTELATDRCPNCPLAPATPRCPTAAHLSGVVARFARTFSYAEAEVRVSVPEREYLKKTSVQEALSSLLGIYMVASGCPVLSALRPMVRLHLPFATELETTWRAASMYLVVQFLRARAGQSTDWDLKGLAEAYRRIGEVNFAFAARLRHAVEQDANLNALVLLDLFAKVLPASIEDGLENLRSLCGPWLAD